jgi:ABC-2 type transport system permease protein
MFIPDSTVYSEETLELGGEKEMSFKDKMKNKGENKKKNGKKFHVKDIVGTISGKHIRNGSYSMVMTVIFVAVVVVINLIVGEIPSKYSQIDISSSKLYTIGDQTKEMLNELEKDVTIYQIAQSGSEDDNITNLLQRYEDESKHITVELKDPVVNPKFVSEYTSDNISSNSLIVVCGDRSKVVEYSNMYESSFDYTTYSYQTTGFDGEGQITSAIGYVTSENLPVMYTLEGHGEVDLDSTIKEDIEKANIDIQTLNLLTEGSVPEDADCLLINSPATDISEDEKDAIIDYLENGGKAMIFSDYTGTEMTNFDAVLENYGVARADGIVFEGDNQHYAMQMPYYLVPTINSTDASSTVASAGYYVLAPYAQGIQQLEDVRDTVEVTSILSTSSSAYSKTNMSSSQIEKEDDDIDGPFSIGVTITESVDDDTETQIVYYSTANILDSQVNQMVSGGNEQLILESLNWLVDTEENTSVSIPSKSLTVSYLTLTAYDASFWKICVIGLIPGAFLVVGFMIWLKRRKA